MSDSEEAVTQEEEFNKQIELAISHLRSTYGAGAVIRFDEDPEPIPAISTGALTLDHALGVGGVPVGRIVELFGNESSGKSTIALSIVAEAQKEGKHCAFVDVEHAVDPIYAKALGVDITKLIFAQPSTGEEALDIVDTLVRTQQFAVIVIDSVAALTPKAELEGEISKDHMGLQSRMMAKAMRKLVGISHEAGTTLIFTNQIREKIGIMFGNLETQPGGRALKFSASVRIQLRKKEDLKNKEGQSNGIKVNARIVKNKVGPPLREAQFDIVYGHGIDHVGCMLDLALEKGVVIQKGPWVSFNGKQIGQGRDKTMTNLANDLDLFDEVVAAVNEA